MEPDEFEKVPKSQILRGPDLLKILPLQTRLFDNVSSASSQSSKLSGPFSDVVYTKEVESKRKAKELYGKDLYTAFAFSSEFKSAIETIKKELPTESPDYVQIDSDADKQEQREEHLTKGVYESIPFPGIDYELAVEEEEEEEIEDKKEKESEREKRKIRAKIWREEDENEEFDAMSGYWRLLSVFDKFRISPPWYDAYAEGQEHWLQTRPIPAEVFENSRRKCLTWLSKYFDN